MPDKPAVVAVLDNSPVVLVGRSVGPVELAEPVGRLADNTTAEEPVDVEPDSYY